MERPEKEECKCFWINYANEQEKLITDLKAELKLAKVHIPFTFNKLHERIIELLK